MVDKLSLPLRIPVPPPSRLFQETSHQHQRQQGAVYPPSAPSPIAPLLQELLHDPLLPRELNPASSPPQLPSQWRRRRPAPSSRKPRLGKHHDPNRGKPWTVDPRVSARGRRILQSLLDSPDAGPARLDELLDGLDPDVDGAAAATAGDDLDSLSVDLLGIIEGLEFHKRLAVALDVFDWARRRHGAARLFSACGGGGGPLAPVVISILGREGRVADAAALLRSMQEEGYSVDFGAAAWS